MPEARARAGEASLADLLLLLEREPELNRINAHVSQKAIGHAGPSGGLALIRCDGGGQFGYGHVKRMVALARSLRDREGIGAVFALNGTEDAADPIRRAGFQVKLAGSGAAALQAIADANKPDILLLDGRDGPSRAELAKLKRGDRRHRCDRRRP